MRKLFVWIAVGLVVLLALVYAFYGVGRGPQETGINYFFGNISTGGSAFLRVDLKHTNVTGTVILPDGISYCSLSEGQSKELCVLATDGRDENPSTNGIISGEIGGSPAVFRGTWMDSKSNRVAIELRQLAKVVTIRAHSGLKVGPYGGTQDFEGAFPEFTSTLPLYQELNRRLRDDAKVEGANFTKDGFEHAVDGIKYPAASNNHEAQSNFQLVYASDQIISLSKSYWEYSGGAHGYGGTTGLNFISSAGKVCEIKLEDLFQQDSDWETQLSKACLADLKKQQASSVVSGSITNFTATNLGSFNIHPCGLIFYFDPYAVASYAEGSFTVMVPWSALRTCLRTDSAITKCLITQEQR